MLPQLNSFGHWCYRSYMRELQILFFIYIYQKLSDNSVKYDYRTLSMICSLLYNVKDNVHLILMKILTQHNV